LKPFGTNPFVSDGFINHVGGVKIRNEHIISST